MKKLFITHRPEELAMALVQANCIGIAVWAFTLADHAFMRFILAQAGVAVACLTRVFLFRMAGSRQRAEAATKTQEA